MGMIENIGEMLIREAATFSINPDIVHTASGCEIFSSLSFLLREIEKNYLMGIYSTVLTIFLVNNFHCHEVGAQKEVSCENIQDNGLWNMKTCDMKGTTKLNSNGYQLSSVQDASIGGLDFSHNKKIFHLPDKVYENFPKLIVYNAYDCSIKLIFRRHFEGLFHLRGLYLNRNLIEKIPLDAFEDLKSLELLYLDDNKIKFINGEIFRGLVLLREVWLKSNECINENFQDNTTVLKLPELVSEQCGFCRTGINITNCQILSKLEEMESSYQRSLETKSTELSNKKFEVNKLEVELKITRDGKTQVENQIKLLETMFHKLEQQFNVTLKSKMAEMEASMALKVKENDEFLAEILKVKEDNIEKDEAIKALTSKLKESENRKC